MRSARVNTAGGFSIEGLPAGNYLVRAVAEADAADWQDLRVLESLRAGATAVTVAGEPGPLAVTREAADPSAPVLWPGVVGPHEVLHLCDLGGTLCHVVFVTRYVVGR